MNIVQFLKARIEDDASAIERRSDFPHSIHLYDPVGMFNNQCPDCLGLPGRDRVLAECTAKRAIIEDWEDPNGPGVWEGYDAGSAIAVDRAARALAAIYSDHPDYDPQWREP